MEEQIPRNLSPSSENSDVDVGDYIEDNAGQESDGEDVTQGNRTAQTGDEDGEVEELYADELVGPMLDEVHAEDPQLAERINYLNDRCGVGGNVTVLTDENEEEGGRIEKGYVW